LDSDQWLEVFHLASKWDMAELRLKAVRAVIAMDMDAAQKAVLGLKHQIKPWALRGLEALARREAPLTAADGQLLGVVHALQLAKVREQSFAASRPEQAGNVGQPAFGAFGSSNVFPPRGRAGYDYTAALTTEFGMGFWESFDGL
jgi:hypothetical protein